MAAVISVLASTGLIGLASPASAATCYGGAHSYTKAEGPITYPANQGSYLYTTGDCADINIKTNSASEVLAGFYPTSGDPYCAERGYVDTKAGTWAVLATDVKDGTKFKLCFATRAASTGVWTA